MSKAFQRVWNAVCWSGTVSLAILISYGLTRMGSSEGREDANAIPVIVKCGQKERQDFQPYVNVKEGDVANLFGVNTNEAPSAVEVMKFLDALCAEAGLVRKVVIPELEFSDRFFL